MTGKIIMWIVCFGCGFLFFAIGLYAQSLRKPMWFWSDADVDPAGITDVKQYNKENGTMWQLYSLWYFGAGLAEIWNTVAAVILLVLSCTVGIALLIRSYRGICDRYQVR